ncbi:MAG: hypothetical protein HND27_06615 [Bacteroidetes bacterium]|nr:hypothetical protein [Bacteroidota bacterium]MBV6460124.1 hypothetical protein [Flavobacteriales bacterium]WKZ73995.1 MAG: DUF5723 family protein [Vicingaceae bacterium]MCL4816474.1 hypothetical protein [Flavobacteriales bacterium]NOG95437.1 hypothetical protein [Bacteroidota bacterium]
MLRIVILLSFLLFGINTKIFAQLNDEYFQKSKNSAGAYSSFNANSNAFTNGFLSAFYNGSFIDSTTKTEVSKKLKNTNRFGFDYTLHVWGMASIDTFLNKTGYSFVAGIQHSEHIDMRFSKDLFNLAFFGNKSFAGKTADAGNFSFNQLRYQEFFAGYFKQTEKFGRLLNEGFTISFVKGEKNAAIKIPEASIYTQEEGKEISLAMQYEYASSDTSKKGVNALNGWGLASDYFTEIPIGDCDKMRFEFTDLGFIFWNKKAFTTTTDTSFVFNGLKIDHILDWKDSVNTSLNNDSLINQLNQKTEFNHYAIALPTTVHFYYQKNFNDKVMIKGGAMMRFFANYTPLLYCKFEYYPTPSLCLNWRFAYGGYGKLTFGMGADKLFLKKYALTVGTQHIEGLLSKTTSGINAYAGFKVYFR